MAIRVIRLKSPTGTFQVHVKTPVMLLNNGIKKPVSLCKSFYQLFHKYTGLLWSHHLFSLQSSGSFMIMIVFYI